MVRAAQLEMADLIAAMGAGDFCASSGVTFKDVRREEGRLSLEIAPERGVTYTRREPIAGLLAAAPALLAAIVGEMERTPGGSVTVDFDYILPESLLAALTAALARLAPPAPHA